MRIAVIANTSWYLFNFRLNLMLALQNAGHEVVAIGPPDGYVDKLRAAGIRHRAIPLRGASVNPLRELGTVWALYRVLREEGMGMALSYTPKGNIYGAIAAALSRIVSLPNVSGLGRVFIHRSPLTWLVQRMYRLTFRRAPCVFFQNREDMDLFVRLGLVNAQRAERIPGSGVDLVRFAPSACEDAVRGDDGFSFLLVARLLWDKGIGEFVAAARMVKAICPQAEFRLLGFLDVQNPAAIPGAQVEAWEAEGIIRYLGATDNVVRFLGEADCVVLPSVYREGVPRTLLEAAAMGKPVITTDAPGCRDAVDEGVTGYLCKPRDAEDLANQMLRLIRLPELARREMGLRGRKKMEQEFDERIVIRKYLETIEAICGSA